MELVNEIYKNLESDISEAVKSTVLLLSPFVPHICEEIWRIMGNKESILKAAWPKYNQQMLYEEIVTMVVQVNGKVRSKINLPVDTSEDRLRELVLSDEKVKGWVKDAAVDNFIVVPGRLVNIVIRPKSS